MANATYSAYASGSNDRRLQVNEFHGVDQSAGVHNRDIASSPDAVNFVVQNGVLRTAGGIAAYGNAIPLIPSEYLAESKPRLFQAFFRDVSGNDFTRIIAAINRRLYYFDTATSDWVSIGPVAKDGCDMVNYRHEATEWAIFTDGDGEAYYWDGTELVITEMNPTQGGEAIKFQQIALLYERLFGAVLRDTPDRLFWSESFGPEAWEPNVSNPDDSAGYADIATFDGSRIRAITTAFGDLLIFKDKTVHRIAGTYPGEWQVSQIFGSNGTLSPRSIVNAGTAVFFLSSDGLCKYDGSTVYTLKGIGDRKLKNTWANLNANAIDNACAVFYNNRIYLSVCLDPEESRNTHVIEYDVTDYTYSVVELPGVDDWLVLREGQKETLLAIIWNQVYRYDTGATFASEVNKNINAVWTSPEFTGASLASKKRTGQVYLTVEAGCLDVDRKPSMKLSMLSGDKVKSRVIPLEVGTQTIRKPVRIKGRSFRFKIENQNGDPLTVHGGFEVVIEEDFD
jgi:hypothetical protein